MTMNKEKQAQADKILEQMYKTLECAICFCILEQLKHSNTCPLCMKSVAKRSLRHQPKLCKIISAVQDVIKVYRTEVPQCISAADKGQTVRNTESDENVKTNNDPEVEDTGVSNRNVVESILGRISGLENVVESPSVGRVTRSGKAQKTESGKTENRYSFVEYDVDQRPKRIFKTRNADSGSDCLNKGNLRNDVGLQSRVRADPFEFIGSQRTPKKTRRNSYGKRVSKSKQLKQPLPLFSDDLLDDKCTIIDKTPTKMTRKPAATSPALIELVEPSTAESLPRLEGKGAENRNVSIHLAIPVNLPTNDDANVGNQNLTEGKTQPFLIGVCNDVGRIRVAESPLQKIDDTQPFVPTASEYVSEILADRSNVATVTDIAISNVRSDNYVPDITPSDEISDVPTNVTIGNLVSDVPTSVTIGNMISHVPTCVTISNVISNVSTCVTVGNTISAVPSCVTISNMISGITSSDGTCVTSCNMVPNVATCVNVSVGNTISDLASTSDSVYQVGVFRKEKNNFLQKEVTLEFDNKQRRYPEKTLEESEIHNKVNTGSINNNSSSPKHLPRAYMDEDHECNMEILKAPSHTVAKRKGQRGKRQLRELEQSRRNLENLDKIASEIDQANEYRLLMCSQDVGASIESQRKLQEVVDRNQSERVTDNANMSLIDTPLLEMEQRISKGPGVVGGVDGFGKLGDVLLVRCEENNELSSSNICQGATTNAVSGSANPLGVIREDYSLNTSVSLFQQKSACQIDLNSDNVDAEKSFPPSVVPKILINKGHEASTNANTNARLDLNFSLSSVVSETPLRSDTSFINEASMTGRHAGGIKTRERNSTQCSTVSATQPRSAAFVTNESRTTCKNPSRNKKDEENPTPFSVVSKTQLRSSALLMNEGLKACKNSSRNEKDEENPTPLSVVSETQLRSPALLMNEGLKTCTNPSRNDKDEENPTPFSVVSKTQLRSSALLMNEGLKACKNSSRNEKDEENPTPLSVVSETQLRSPALLMNEGLKTCTNPSRNDKDEENPTPFSVVSETQLKSPALSMNEGLKACKNPSRNEKDEENPTPFSVVSETQLRSPALLMNEGLKACKNPSRNEKDEENPTPFSVVSETQLRSPALSMNEGLKTCINPSRNDKDEENPIPFSIVSEIQRRSTQFLPFSEMKPDSSPLTNQMTKLHPPALHAIFSDASAGDDFVEEDNPFVEAEPMSDDSTEDLGICAPNDNHTEQINNVPSVTDEPSAGCRDAPLAPTNSKVSGAEENNDGRCENFVGIADSVEGKLRRDDEDTTAKDTGLGNGFRKSDYDLSINADTQEYDAFSELSYRGRGKKDVELYYSNNKTDYLDGSRMAKIDTPNAVNEEQVCGRDDDSAVYLIGDFDKGTDEYEVCLVKDKQQSPTIGDVLKKTPSVEGHVAGEDLRADQCKSGLLNCVSTYEEVDHTADPAIVQETLCNTAELPVDTRSHKQKNVVIENHARKSFESSSNGIDAIADDKVVCDKLQEDGDQSSKLNRNSFASSSEVYADVFASAQTRNKLGNGSDPEDILKQANAMLDNRNKLDLNANESLVIPTHGSMLPAGEDGIATNLSCSLSKYSTTSVQLDSEDSRGARGSRLLDKSSRMLRRNKRRLVSLDPSQDKRLTKVRVVASNIDSLLVGTVQAVQKCSKNALIEPPSNDNAGFDGYIASGDDEDAVNLNSKRIRRPYRKEKFKSKSRQITAVGADGIGMESQGKWSIRVPKNSGCESIVPVPSTNLDVAGSDNDVNGDIKSYQPQLSTKLFDVECVVSNKTNDTKNIDVSNTDDKVSQLIREGIFSVDSSDESMDDSALNQFPQHSSKISDKEGIKSSMKSNFSESRQSFDNHRVDYLLNDSLFCKIQGHITSARNFVGNRASIFHDDNDGGVDVHGGDVLTDEYLKGINRRDVSSPPLKSSDKDNKIIALSEDELDSLDSIKSSTHTKLGHGTQREKIRKRTCKKQPTLKKVLDLKQRRKRLSSPVTDIDDSKTLENMTELQCNQSEIHPMSGVTKHASEEIIFNSSLLTEKESAVSSSQDSLPDLDSIFGCDSAIEDGQLKEKGNLGESQEGRFRNGNGLVTTMSKIVEPTVGGVKDLLDSKVNGEYCNAIAEEFNDSVASLKITEDCASKCTELATAMELTCNENQTSPCIDKIAADACVINKQSVTERDTALDGEFSGERATDGQPLAFGCAELVSSSDDDFPVITKQKRFSQVLSESEDDNISDTNARNAFSPICIRKSTTSKLSSSLRFLESSDDEEIVALNHQRTQTPNIAAADGGKTADVPFGLKKAQRGIQDWHYEGPTSDLRDVDEHHENTALDIDQGDSMESDRDDDLDSCVDLTRSTLSSQSEFLTTQQRDNLQAEMLEMKSKIAELETLLKAKTQSGIQTHPELLQNGHGDHMSGQTTQLIENKISHWNGAVNGTQKDVGPKARTTLSMDGKDGGDHSKSQDSGQLMGQPINDEGEGDIDLSEGENSGNLVGKVISGDHPDCIRKDSGNSLDKSVVAKVRNSVVRCKATNSSYTSAKGADYEVREYQDREVGLVSLIEKCCDAGAGDSDKVQNICKDCDDWGHMTSDVAKSQHSSGEGFSERKYGHIEKSSVNKIPDVHDNEGLDQHVGLSVEQESVQNKDGIIIPESESFDTCLDSQDSRLLYPEVVPDSCDDLFHSPLSQHAGDFVSRKKRKVHKKGPRSILSEFAKDMMDHSISGRFGDPIRLDAAEQADSLGRSSDQVCLDSAVLAQYRDLVSLDDVEPTDNLAKLNEPVCLDYAEKPDSCEGQGLVKIGRSESGTGLVAVKDSLVKSRVHDLECVAVGPDGLVDSVSNKVLNEGKSNNDGVYITLDESVCVKVLRDDLDSENIDGLLNKSMSLIGLSERRLDHRTKENSTKDSKCNSKSGKIGGISCEMHGSLEDQDSSWLLFSERVANDSGLNGKESVKAGNDSELLVDKSVVPYGELSCNSFGDLSKVDEGGVMKCKEPAVSPRKVNDTWQDSFGVPTGFLDIGDAFLEGPALRKQQSNSDGLIGSVSLWTQAATKQDVFHGLPPQKLSVMENNEIVVKNGPQLKENVTGSTVGSASLWKPSISGCDVVDGVVSPRKSSVGGCNAVDGSISLWRSSFSGCNVVGGGVSPWKPSVSGCNVVGGGVSPWKPSVSGCDVVGGGVSPWEPSVSGFDVVGGCVSPWKPSVSGCDVVGGGVSPWKPSVSGCDVVGGGVSPWKPSVSGCDVVGGGVSPWKPSVSGCNVVGGGVSPSKPSVSGCDIVVGGVSPWNPLVSGCDVVGKGVSNIENSSVSVGGVLPWKLDVGNNRTAESSPISKKPTILGSVSPWKPQLMQNQLLESPWKRAVTRHDSGSHVSLHPSTRKRLCFVSDGLVQSQVLEVRKLADYLGALLCDRFTPAATHVILPSYGGVDGNEARLCERTLKYMQGVSNHCWIVSHAWVKDSLQGGTALPEEDYEIEGDNHSGITHYAPKRSRSSDRPLFLGFEFYLFGNSSNPTESQLRDMLEMGGATVVLDPRFFSFDPRRNCLIIDQSESVSDTVAMSNLAAYKKFRRDFDLLTLSKDWALDSIAQYRAQPLNKYTLTPAT